MPWPATPQCFALVTKLFAVVLHQVTFSPYARFTHGLHTCFVVFFLFFCWETQASLDMYGKILTAIEANNYDNFRKRAYISKTEKLLTLPFSYAKSLNPGQINLVS